MFSNQVNPFIELHELKPTRATLIEIVSLLRKANEPKCIVNPNAVDHKHSFFSGQLHRDFLHAHFPTLGHVNMVNATSISQTLIPGTVHLADGQASRSNGEGGQERIMTA